MARILLTMLLIFATIFISVLPVMAQRNAPLPLGTVSGITQLGSCPSGFLLGMTCYQAQIACPSTASVGLTYGVENPTAALKGTIVFLGGSDGTLPYGVPDYAGTYLASGFQVVQFAWDSAWEDTSTPSPSLQTAACRPATFLNYIATGIYRGGGMCVQGLSGGSAAVAYTLAWYGGMNFLDKAELISGPVFSDIEKGCEVPDASTVTVCSNGQFGCNGKPWQDSPTYLGEDAIAVGSWTGDSSCAGTKRTNSEAETDWKQMSIVDGTNNPSFTYPHTAMAAWLCSSDAKEQNNSAAEGEFFYSQFTSSKQTAGFSVTRIDHCNNTEGVEQGFTPQGVLGLTAVTNDMINSCANKHKTR